MRPPPFPDIQETAATAATGSGDDADKTVAREDRSPELAGIAATARARRRPGRAGGSSPAPCPVGGGEAEVFAAVLGTNRIEVDIHGSANGAASNFDTVRHFDSVNDLTYEIVDARTCAGLHYRWSSVRGVILGHKAAHWALQRFFMPAQ